MKIYRQLRKNAVEICMVSKKHSDLKIIERSYEYLQIGIHLGLVFFMLHFRFLSNYQGIELLLLLLLPLLLLLLLLSR